MSGFLEQFLSRRFFGSFALFDVAGRDFEGSLSRTMPELANEQQAALGVERDYRSEIGAL
jgi:hypothetical protein